MALDRLHLNNFKSYGGKHVIGPFRTFTAVIGPNGAGKSNLMDAISFVLGVQTRHLRGSQLKDLIHKKESEREGEQSRTAYVQLVYKALDGDEISFKRSIDAHGTAKYWLGGKHVKWDQYNDKLRSIGVLVKARNFLVFQGDVGSIASKNALELTQLFEIVSGSGDLQKDYTQLKELADKAEDEFLGTFEKKRNIVKEKKQMKEQKEEAERFKKLIDDQKNTKLEFFLWQLFNVEKDLEINRKALEVVKNELKEKQNMFATLDEEVKSKQQQHAQVKKSVFLLGKAINRKTKLMEKKRPAQIQLNEHITFLKRTVKAGEGQVSRLQSAQSKKEDQIKNLKTTLLQVAKDILTMEKEKSRRRTKIGQ